MKWLAAALLTWTAIVSAQPYPSKPIRFIVSFPPGGSSDLIARAIAPRMSERLGQPVVVENRAGAGGMIGVEAIAKAPPDGYVIGLAAAGALSSNIHLYPSMPYHPEKDLTPISLLAMIPFFLVAHPSQPSSLKELIETAKAKPGALSYGHGGQGSTMHLAGELLNMMASIRIQAVPYNKLNSEIRDALSALDVRERALSAGAEPFPTSPQEFAAMIREETKKWGDVVKAANIKLQ
jgi:tripartite-type tricarboxylate transporter receptor subunit TctC